MYYGDEIGMLFTTNSFALHIQQNNRCPIISSNSRITITLIF